MPGREVVRGYVEKKKDWLKRAKDYQGKESKLRKLRQKAESRNKDEFNFHMLNSQLNGVHYEMETSDEETEVQKLFNDVRDLEYVTNRLTMERKKIEKLKAELHFVDAAKTSKIIFINSDDEDIKTKVIQQTNTPKERPISLEREKERQKKYDELLEHLQREKELKIVIQKLQLKKDLAKSKNQKSIKPKLEKKGGPTKPAVYRWVYERKK